MQISDQCTLEATFDERIGFEERERLLDMFRDNWITERDWEIMEDFGLNAIRLPFTWNVIEDENNPMTLRTDAWQYIDYAIEEAEARGMYVILDLHRAVGAQAHRDVARQAVRESLVLLKNKNSLLPLSPNQHILVAGDGANNIGKQSGGWSVTWQGTGNKNDDFPGGTSIYDGIEKQVGLAGGTATLSVDGSYQKQPDVAVVVFGEDPYAEGNGDRDNLDYQQGDKKHLALLKRLKQQGIPVVALFISGRPMWVNAELNASDALVAVWLPGSEGNGIADVILANADNEIQHDFKGKLSYSWPNTADQTRVNRHDKEYAPLLPYGYGLAYGDKTILSDNLDESIITADGVNPIKEIFTGSVKAPWLMWLFSDDEQIEVNSNTHKFGALKYRTVDKVVQEDAFKIKLDGSANSGVRFMSKSTIREDLRSSLVSESALQFDVKLSSKASEQVMLSMYCESEVECGYSQNITTALNQLPINEWHTVSVDLACFDKNGMSFGDTTTPFELSSIGQLDISFANIALTPHQEGKALINCH